MERRNSRKFLNARYWGCTFLFNTLVLTGFCLVLFKAFQLQIVQYAVWLDRARGQAETTFKVPSYRGSIYDRHGRLLSYSVPQRSLFADCEKVEKPKVIANKLSKVLHEPTGEMDRKLACNRHFVWLKRHLTDQQAVAVEEFKGRGLHLVDEYKRFYPYRQVGGQVLGFVDVDGTGLEGVEKAFDHVLRESSKTVGQIRDGVKNTLLLTPSTLPEPKESYGVRLTIDALIQYVAERELEKAVLQYRAKAGEVVVIDTHTSEVLAMANWPFFDPNLGDKKNADSWRNRTVTDSFEPGSTFKVFLVGGALDEGIIKERDRVFCENGKCTLAGHTINDVHPYGWLTIPEVVKFSSNIAASKIALQMGKERYARIIQAFGFGSLTGINLPGEVKGQLRPVKRWRPIDLATTGFGQSIGVTALQLTLGIATIANKGIYTPPLIARDIVNSAGHSVRTAESQPLRRVIQEKTARQLCDMMRSVTEEGGTGVKAAPEGYTAAGKTGTAQILDPETRHYASNRYTSIFTGFIPADHPRLAISVVVHEPHGAIYGGVVAAPVFKNISAKVLPYLGIPPTLKDVNPPSEPRLVKAAPGEAQKVNQGVKKASVSKVSSAETPSRASKPSPRPANGLSVEAKEGKAAAVARGPSQGAAGSRQGGPVELVLNNVGQDGRM
ncbi:MAG: penicillin-binding protein 2 [Syntrophobacteraceae bacterium]|nr:penicillin-binding protein 2 [Syntrophobacteraceae bacterium]